MPLSDNIRKYRELRGLSVQGLADKMNIGRAGIYKWEAGENKPGQESLEALSKALDVSVDELLGEKHTSVQELTDNKEMDKDKLYRDLVESNTEYRLIPKVILDDYRIVPKSELDERAAMWKETLAAKNYAIAQLEKEIAILRGVGQASVQPQNAQ